MGIDTSKELDLIKETGMQHHLMKIAEAFEDVGAFDYADATLMCLEDYKSHGNSVPLWDKFMSSDSTANFIINVYCEEVRFNKHASKPSRKK